MALLSMFDRRRGCRVLCVLVVLALAVGIVYVSYYCPDRVCSKMKGPVLQQQPDSRKTLQFEDEQLIKDYTDFDGEEEDVIVFLHMQKTGGTTFGRHLVKNLDVESPCQCVRGRKRCDCYTPHSHIWLFSRFSTGWSCGLHADWTELKGCVDEMLDKKELHHRARRYRYLYITILREPVSRFLSEWKHVQRGATWISTKLKCNGRQATLEEVPFCFEEKDWSGVSLEDFMNCDSNLAINRQVRMLANLSLVHCYNKSAMTEETRNAIMLQSAKQNLADMAFFGLTEFQKETQYMFENTFKLHFIEDFEQKNLTTASRADVLPEQLEQIKQLNNLDVELYNYAKELFMQRLKYMKERNSDKDSTTQEDNHR